MAVLGEVAQAAGPVVETVALEVGLLEVNAITKFFFLIYL